MTSPSKRGTTAYLRHIVHLAGSVTTVTGHSTPSAWSSPLCKGRCPIGQRGNTPRKRGVLRLRRIVPLFLMEKCRLGKAQNFPAATMRDCRSFVQLAFTPPSCYHCDRTRHTEGVALTPPLHPQEDEAPPFVRGDNATQAWRATTKLCD